MTKKQFVTKAEEISRRAQVMDGLHGYFSSHASRLHHCCELFNLFSENLGDVLEIGPFYGYTPFLLRQNSSKYKVLEGDDPTVYPLKPLYDEAAIQLSFVDFFEMFGPTHNASHKLAEADSSYDTILCWETMEHFNFNPVKFVRELHRVLKPSGQVCITVPNRGSFQSIYSLLFGRNQNNIIKSYFTFEDYVSNGKKAFYGFHWREYTPKELASLFNQAGFEVKVCKTFTAFQDHAQLKFTRKVARIFARVSSRLFNRFGTHVYLIANKKNQQNF